MIEEHGIRFFLTGSSARSLRRRGVNLLGGRIRSRRLHPVVRTELGTRFELHRALEYGLLPPIYFSDAPAEDLAAYAGDYLKEEVAAEALVRNVGAFSRFLEVAALAHGEMINFTNMANDAQVPVSTVREYYGILKDTLIAHEVPAFAQTSKRKAISTAKYYLFDIGLARHLQGRTGLRRELPSTGAPSRATYSRRSRRSATTTGWTRPGTGVPSRTSKWTSWSENLPSRSRRNALSANATYGAWARCATRTCSTTTSSCAWSRHPEPSMASASCPGNPSSTSCGAAS